VHPRLGPREIAGSYNSRLSGRQLAATGVIAARNASRSSRRRLFPRLSGAVFPCGVLASALAFLVFSAVYQWPPGSDTPRETPLSVFSGDEPHYLIAIHSILFDGDLDVRNNYANIRHGGWDAGARFRWRRLDHHTYSVDARNRRAVLWVDQFDFSRPIRCRRRVEDEQCFARKPGASADFSSAAKQVPAHPPAFAAMLAALIAPFSPEPQEVERTAFHLLIFCGWILCIVTFVAGRRLELRAPTAALALVALVLASPLPVYTRSLYVETPSALFVLLAYWGLVEGRVVAGAIAAAIAMLLKPALVVISWGWIAYLLLQREYRDAAVLTGVVGAVGICLCAFNHQLAGTWVVAGSQGWEPIDSWWGIVNVPAALSSYESWSKPFYASGATLFQRMLT